MKTDIIKICGGYQVTFTQGMQTFHVGFIGIKKEAKWMKERLDITFENYRREIRTEKYEVEKEINQIIKQTNGIKLCKTW
jgi:hypothetical protein